MYIFWFLHQTTTKNHRGRCNICCISFDSYIKPQQINVCYRYPEVVYLLIPTSNHNLMLVLILFIMLYIFWFLHQTTTILLLAIWIPGCISFDSYIKPQPRCGWKYYRLVVYLLIPTSNHNAFLFWHSFHALYIFWFLHQTTTYAGWWMPHAPLYIFWFLHQTTTSRNHVVKGNVLYIFWFLHQTTTYRFESTDFQCIPITFSNKKWRVEYNFLCKSTKKTPIESVRW